MSPLTGFLDGALHALADSFGTMTTALESAGAFRNLLQQLGWELDPAVDDAHFGPVQAAFAVERPQLAALAGADGVALAVAIPALFASLLRPRGPNPAWPSPLDAPAFWTDTAAGPSFPRELVDRVLRNALVDHAPAALGILQFVGVFNDEDRPAVAAAGGMPARAAYTRLSIDWSRLPAAITRPTDIFADVYHWNGVGGAFDHARLLTNIAGLLEGVPIGVSVGPSSDSAYDLYFDRLPTSPPEIEQVSGMPLSYPSPAGPVWGSAKLSLNALPIPPAGARTGDPSGFSLFPIVTGQAGAQTTIADGVTISLNGEFRAMPLFLEIRPSGTTLRTLGAAAATLNAEARVDAHAPAAPWKLFGSDNSTRLELSAAHLRITAQGSPADPAVTIEIGLDHAALVVDFGSGDSFLQSVLGAAPQQADLSCTVSWSSRTGVRFGGEARLEVTIPVHASILGVVTLDTIYVLFGANGSRCTLAVTLSGSVMLGPISASIDRVGLGLAFVPSADATGNLGIVDVDCTFQPPRGVGLALEAGPITGGGFLAFDNEKHQYAGGLELSLEALQLKAFGLVQTVPEVSFLIIISADFPPIELGLGFALVGVGGLLGVNRTMSLDALRSSLRAHTLDDTLFLTDPASHAQEIIPTIAAIFPPLPGHFVFGPFFKIGWGKPVIMSAQLGVILTLPDPVRLAILGTLVVAIPDPDAAIVLLHLDVLGTVDFERRSIAVDASLYDSYIAAFTVLGDMAFRLDYGERSNFALSVGGLNPRFQPPPGFPTLRRLTVSLGLEDNPRISVVGYFAVTSNSLQFGAQAELYAEAAGFGVHGYIGFDALIVLDPFGFMIDFRVGIDLLAGGSVFLSLHFEGWLSGPTPWHLHGEASFSVLFFSISVNIDVSFGPDQPGPSIPALDTIAPFQQALADARNWSAELPGDVGRVATLAATAASQDLVVVHPLGRLTFVQRVLPLDVVITKFGNATPATADEFVVTGVVLNGASSAPSDETIVMAEFADGQFFQLSDAEKLSKPSFTDHDAGVRFGLGGIADLTIDVVKQVRYDTFIKDDPVVRPRRGAGKYALRHDTALAQAGYGAVAGSLRRVAGPQRYLSPGLKSVIGVDGPRYVVTSTDDLGVRGDIASIRGGGYFDVQARLEAYVAQNPAERDTLQIIALHELDGVA